MKKLILITVVCFSILAACKKDDDPSKKDLLCAKNWKITSAVMTTGLLSIDAYQAMEACEKDDITKFNTDGVVLYDSKTKCNINDPATETGTWVFNSDQTIITFDGSESWEIVELTSSTLKVKYQFEQDGVLFTMNMTLIGL